MGASNVLLRPTNAKIGAERLLSNHLNQSMSRSEEYVHLRDAIGTVGHVNPDEVGKMVR